LPMLSPYAGNGSWASMVRPRRLSFVNPKGSFAFKICFEGRRLMKHGSIPFLLFGLTNPEFLTL
jgi:hypothetical protein